MERPRDEVWLARGGQVVKGIIRHVVGGRGGDKQLANCTVGGHGPQKTALISDTSCKFWVPMTISGLFAREAHRTQESTKIMVLL